MFGTLRWRLTLWYGGMAVGLLVLLSAILYFNVRVSLIADSRDEVRSAAALARGVLEETGSPEAAARAREPGVWVIIRDSEGAVLAASRVPRRSPS